MTEIEQQKACWTLAGWKDIHFYEDNAGPSFWSGTRFLEIEETFTLSKSDRESITKYGVKLPNCDSYDFILPLIQKQHRNILARMSLMFKAQNNVAKHVEFMLQTPAQLRELLLKSRDLWREE